MLARISQKQALSCEFLESLMQKTMFISSGPLLYAIFCYDSSGELSDEYDKKKAHMLKTEEETNFSLNKKKVYGSLIF